VPGITLSAIDKIYDNGFHAVKNANLEIHDEEFMVLVGPSGCGKTTTLRMIAGLEDISDGEVRIGDRVINNVEPKNRDIAMVFQNYALYPHMTIWENMAYGLKSRKTPKAEIQQKVEWAAKMLGLDTQLSKRPKALSGGQRQRVALGRAIVRQPKAFLFDEPLSNLDAKLRGDMRYELKTLQQDLKTTTVYVTHDQIEAMTLGDRITVMNAGVIQQVAEHTTLYDRPWNRFVAGFIGTPPMNFLDGSLDRSGERPCVRSADGTSIELRMPDLERLGELPDGSPVSLGIRPEHLADLRYPHSSEVCATMGMEVRVVEVLGDHQYVYLRPPGGSDEQVIIMKNSSHAYAKPGEQVQVALDTRMAHVFAGTEPDSENLTLPKGFAQQQ
jgi:multiple sugar transport system ATP-binding protein